MQSPLPGPVLPLSFYLRPTPEVARDLLGALFVRETAEGRIVGRIVETEAYHEDDEASHSHRGRTARNAVMFGPPGRLYVYFTYGMHYCMNVVTEEEGVGSAVLIRAIEPLEGCVLMRGNRLRRSTARVPTPRPNPDRHLGGGPARACAAYDIDRTANGASLSGPDLHLCAGAPASPSSPRTIITSTRIGISRATHLAWRFHLAGNPCVSHP